MGFSKKTKTISIRLPERTKRLIEEEADRNTRSFQDECVVLLAESLHVRKHNIKNYT